METSDLTALLSTAFDEEVYIAAPDVNHMLPGRFSGALPPNLPPLNYDDIDLQAARPSANPKTTNLWDPRLIIDLAIGIDDLTTILPRYDLSEAEFNVLSETPIFRRELAMAMRDARENGLPFSSKARVQAEGYLEVLDELVYGRDTPASVRLEAIRSTVKWGRLEVEKGTQDAGNAPAINISINF